ncbi:MAG: rhodanese-related sulfurtransferase [Legionellaceae bacterium]|nr:rhodanese-related sulfurtransferase [Legionellaceae bacterium]
MKQNQIVVSALYKFAPLPQYHSMREPLLSLMQSLDIKGTLLLAAEGINGTIAGRADAVRQVLEWLQQQPGLDGIGHKESFHDQAPFKRCKVKLKKEIVTMGVEGVDPLKVAGTYVKPQDWNRLISAEDVLTIDTRNDYEVEIGRFKHAVNPETTSFREFPEYVKQTLDPQKHKKIAMYCTGGIRCEKSTAYLKSLGFSEVYHLEGGILKYLEEVPADVSLWEGECFVFDERVAVNHALEKGQYDQCHACRFPITDADKQSQYYQPGISCPRCYAQCSAEQKARFAEREKQNQLARQRGESHIGAEVGHIIRKRRQAKQSFKQAQHQHACADVAHERADDSCA